MDRIIKITAGLIVAILVITFAIIMYNGYISSAYQSTRVSSFSYTLSITTDSPLQNVTLFIPVPADPKGNSPAITEFSAQKMPGMPVSWQAALFDTGKATLVKIHTPEVSPPPGTTPQNPYTVTMYLHMPSEKTIDTADPLTNSPMFRPVSSLQKTPCTGALADRSSGSPVCSMFLTSIYADYIADPNAAVTITSSVSGKNSWTVFEPESNEYTSDISLLMHGANHGWATAKGNIAERIGSFASPFRLT